MMPELRILILTLAIGLPPIAIPLAAQQLTLPQAVARVLENNPELAQDLPIRGAAEAEYRASRAAYLPRLDFEQSYTGGNNPVYVFGTLLSQRRFTEANFGIPSLNEPDAIDNLQTRLSAGMKLYDFGRTRRSIESARIGIELADRDHEDRLRRVLLELLEAYYSVSLAREHREAARAALESTESLVGQARARVESGLAVEADLLRSQVQLAAARQEDIESRGRWEMARARLNRLMGDSLDAQIGETEPLNRVAWPSPQESELVALQREKRPDYQRLLAEMRRLELEVKNYRAQFLPSLDAFAAWEADNPSLRNTGGTNWTAGVSLRWNLFAGGADLQRLEAAQNRLEQKKRQVAAMESAMALEIRRALIGVRTAEQQVEVRSAAESQSLESLRILRNRYDAGLATLTDLLSAETARVAARAAFADALFRQRISYAELEFAAGILDPSSRATNP